MRSDLDVLGQTSAAGVNWVVTAAALPLARYLQKRFRTPFIAGLPVGAQETERIIRGLRAAMNGAPVLNPFPPNPERTAETPSRALLIGEGLFCASLRAQMEIEQHVTPVQIGSFFTESQGFFRDGDRIFGSEGALSCALADPNLELVAGDPLIRKLLPADSPAKFMEIPHRAVSGRLYP